MHLYGANEAVTPLPVPELGAVVGSASVVVGSVVSSSVVGSVVSSEPGIHEVATHCGGRGVFF